MCRLRRRQSQALRVNSKNIAECASAVGELHACLKCVVYLPCLWSLPRACGRCGLLDGKVCCLRGGWRAGLQWLCVARDLRLRVEFDGGNGIDEWVKRLGVVYVAAGQTLRGYA